MIGSGGELTAKIRWQAANRTEIFRLIGLVGLFAYITDHKPLTLNTMKLQTYPTGYKVPKKNVLVIGCIDPRLLDDLGNFLNRDNLQNRYDHFVLAGTSLLCSHQEELFVKDLPGVDSYGTYSRRWRKTLFDHLDIAIALHQIKDVYIVEHEDCGAYTHFLDKKKVDLSSREEEIEWHRKFAAELAKEIHGTEYEETDGDGNRKKYRLGVHCFFIDLRGDVELLETLPPVY